MWSKAVLSGGCMSWMMLASFMAFTGCASMPPAERADQTAFSSPEAAVDALKTAASTGDEATLTAIFGSEGEEILSSGDVVADRSNREVFVTALDQQWSLADVEKGRKELIIGHEQWPFPVPLVKDRDGWRFDTLAGKWEVLARRVGRNELAAINVCRVYVLAQRKYAGEDSDGKREGPYAQKVRSTPGEKDGLYWQTDPGESPSPLSDLAAQAEKEGYSTEGEDGGKPFHGYYYRILKKQGPSSASGPKDYIVDGQMTGGFALIAWPAEYGNSGVMTFIVNQSGFIYEADLGGKTAEIVAKIEAYNPDPRWKLVD